MFVTKTNVFVQPVLIILGPPAKIKIKFKIKIKLLHRTNEWQSH